VIAREPFKCNACNEAFLGRIGVGSGTLPLIFQCPRCGTALRASLEPEPETLDLNFKSEDVIRLEDGEIENEEELTSITIYTDLPVPKALQGIPAGEAVASPFILLGQLIGTEEQANLMARIETMRDLRRVVFPRLRRAASLVGEDGFEPLSAAVERLPHIDEIDGLADLHPLYQLGRYMETLYVPFALLEPRIMAIGELGMLLLSAEQVGNGPEHLRKLVERPDWIQHRRRIYETTIAALGLVEALMPAMAWEMVDESQVDINDYLVMRDDFDRLKSTYQDIFELGSRSLAYIGSILNLVARGDPREFSNGKRCSLTRALRTTANNREFILDEMPNAKAFYEQIDRHTRNDIGHHLVSFDFATQTLIDNRGDRTNYLRFLEDFLGAVRFTAYLLALAEKVTLHAVQADIPQRRDAGLPITP
jgi:hypothetical protein